MSASKNNFINACKKNLIFMVNVIRIFRKTDHVHEKWSNFAAEGIMGCN